MARRIRPRLVLLFLASLPSLPAGSARAWTEARVTTAAATLAVDPSGGADVDLELGIGIDAGWLEGLEIAGLDPDLLLDPAHVVVLVSEEGERFGPAVRALGDGRVMLSFPRRDAPRRGRYRARLRYHTELGGRTTTPTGHGSVRFEWTLPGWQSGLDGVSIQIVAPRGAVLPPEETSAQSTIRSDVRDGAEGTLLTLRRAHLPRTVPWTVAFEVPEGSVDAALRGPRAHAALPPPRLPEERDRDLPKRMELLIALFAVAGVAKRAAYDRAVRARGASPLPVVPLGATGHAIAVLACAGAAIALGREGLELYPLPLLGILALSLQRPVTATTAPRLGAFRPAAPEHFARARRALAAARLEPLRFLDASQPGGLATTACALAAVFASTSNETSDLAFTSPQAAILFVALMLTSPATRLPSTPDLRLQSLVALAERLRVPLTDGGNAMALRLLVHEDADGRLQDARLRVCTESRPDGLVRLDLIRLDRDGLGGHRSTHALLVVTRAGSLAERLVADVLPRLAVQRAPAGRRARIGSIGTDLEPLVAALAAKPSGATPARMERTGARDVGLATAHEPRLAS